MYRPAHFREDDPVAIGAFVDAYPLAAVVAMGPDGFVANHLPLLRLVGDDGSSVLRGHVARANELWKVVPDGAPVIAIFRGEDHYVSPGWYPTKAETGEVVPTWNYVVANAHGRIRFIQDAAWLRELVGSLTRHHERTQARPWSIEDAPEAYLARMLGAIVGFEIAVERIEAKRKSSQNRTERERAGVVKALTDEGISAAARDQLVRGR
jgi:transcriptional regulator